MNKMPFLLLLVLFLLKSSLLYSQVKPLPHDVGSFDNLTAYNGKLFFSQDDGIHGKEVWYCDEVNAPQMIADIYEGGSGSDPENFIVYNNKLYFTADNGINGKELWVIDGLNPPQMVVDLFPGSTGSIPANLYVFHNNIFFSATQDYSYKNELFVYDGVESPKVVMGRSIGDDTINYTSSCVAYNDRLYVPAYVQSGVTGLGLYLYYIEEPTPGSYTVNYVEGTENFSPLTAHAVYQDTLFYAHNGHLWFLSTDHQTGRKFKINRGEYSSQINDIIVFNNTLIFPATDTLGNNELWLYDGNQPAYSFEIFSGYSGSVPQYLTIYDQKLYFLASSAGNGRELWMYDGINTPELHADIVQGSGSSFPRYFAELNGSLYFRASREGKIQIWTLSDELLSNVPKNSDVEDQVLLFPNPSSGIVTLKATKGERYYIINGTGKIIKNLEQISKVETTVDLTYLPPGVYYLIGEGQEKTIREKFVIRH